MPKDWDTFPLLHPDHIADQLARYPSVRRCWIALSGGRDSIVLLDLCASLLARYPDISFRAAHIHHGLHEAADKWTFHCQSVCNQYSIPLLIVHVNAKGQPGESPEEAARNARYHAFEALIELDDVLMVAHHEDDQAETMLLQLLRGAGLEGIAGMPEHAKFGKGHLLRPLLRIESRQILDYAQKRQLRWIEDPSNRETKYDRNYLRHIVMPELKKRWPAASRVLSRASRHAANAAKTQRNLQSTLSAEIAPKGHFDLKAAESLDDTHLRLAIRGWFGHQDLRMPSERMIECFIHDFIQSGSDRSPTLKLYDGSQLQRYRQMVYRLPPQAEVRGVAWPHWRRSLSLPENNGMMEMSAIKPGADHTPIWENQPIEIRYRSGGERIALTGRQGHHDLRDLFQEAGIPPWVRFRIPLVYVGDQLACVGDFWPNADAFSPEEWASSPQPRWTPPEGLDPSGALKSLQQSGRLSR